MALKAYKKEMSQVINLLKEDKVNLRNIRKLLNELHNNEFNFNSKYYLGKTLLHYAIENDCEKIIPIVINYGCNPNICDDSYMTPLHVAVTKGNIVAVKMLIKKGADVNMGGEFEQTPLHLAVICGNLKITKLLINFGADVQLVDEKNLSVLDYAKDEKNNVIIEYLRKKFNIQKGEE